MNAIELLRKQHRDAEVLFERILGSDLPDRQRALFEQLAHALTVHTVLEEQHFYPAVRAKGTEELVREFLLDHREVKKLLSELLRLDPEEGKFQRKLLKLQNEVENHLAQEERELLPKAERILGAELLVELGQTMVQVMDALSEIDPREFVDTESESAQP